MSPGRDRHLFSHRGLERPPLSTRTSLEPIGLRAMSAADEPTRGHRPLVDPPADRRASVARRPRESLVGRRLIDKLAKLGQEPGNFGILGLEFTTEEEWIAPRQGQLISPPSSAGTATLATTHQRN